MAIPRRRRLGQQKKQVARRTHGALGPNTSTGFEASCPASEDLATARWCISAPVERRRLSQEETDTDQ